MSTSQMQSPSRERRQLLVVGQFLLLFVDLCVFQQHLSRPSDYQCVSLFVFCNTLEKIYGQLSLSLSYGRFTKNILKTNYE